MGAADPSADSQEREPAATFPAAPSGGVPKATDLRIVRYFLYTLALLLAGYAFAGRGFAHLGIPPLYLSEFVLAFGLVATAVAAYHRRLNISIPPLLVILLVFMGLGLLRTLPYVRQYGVDAFRDATLWGYAVFGIMLFLLLDREWLLRLFKMYGFLAVAFLIWGPIAYYLWGATGSNIPMAPGSNVQILFVKSQDMAVHTAGAIAFLIVGLPAMKRVWDFVWRVLISLPAAWMVYTTGAITRGGLAAVAGSVAVLAAVSGRTRNAVPVLCGAALFVVMVGANVTLPAIGPSPTMIAVASPTTIAVASPTTIAVASPSALPSGQTPGPSSSVATPAPAPTLPPAPETGAGRSVTAKQWWENIASIFVGSTDVNLGGTRQFRIDWWKDIIHYTFQGPYFWTGKGFGINLADADGFQPTADHSLRAPHNSHLSVLARMGVPGFLLWILLQAGFGLLLLRAVFRLRRAGDNQLAAMGIWIGVFWTAMMINTSFDPYLEGPQGGIWFWTLFGLGLLVMKMAPKRKVA